ncbi:MAG TPA: hypothetical protein VGR28_01840 [Candidatus Thermoplasmatota archaeon]|jgi:hypothetical protein|nr:hypothetical protein [Candidatus Thermoplasmatota archaeon]
MPTPKLAEAPLRTRWEANCLFCGDQLPDEGPAFLDHVGAKPACHDAYDAWLENLDHDRPGG